MKTMLNVIALVGVTLLAGCAGGAREAAQMPTPILCKTILDLSPTYVRYSEYIAELNARKEDCAKYVGDTQNIRVR